MLNIGLFSGQFGRLITNRSSCQNAPDISFNTPKRPTEPSKAKPMDTPMPVDTPRTVDTSAMASPATTRRPSCRFRGPFAKGCENRRGALNPTDAEHP